MQNAQVGADQPGRGRGRQFEHAIAVLTGAILQAFSIAVKALSAAPPAVPDRPWPSQLLERRPDMRPRSA